MLSQVTQCELLELVCGAEVFQSVQSGINCMLVVLLRRAVLFHRIFKPRMIHHLSGS